MTTTPVSKRSISCYSCRESFEYDFVDIQRERIEVMYSQIKENDEQARNYYVRCPHCEKFNRSRH